MYEEGIACKPTEDYCPTLEFTVTVPISIISSSNMPLFSTKSAKNPLQTNIFVQGPYGLFSWSLPTPKG